MLQTYSGSFIEALTLSYLCPLVDRDPKQRYLKQQGDSVFAERYRTLSGNRDSIPTAFMYTILHDYLQSMDKSVLKMREFRQLLPFGELDSDSDNDDDADGKEVVPRNIWEWADAIKRDIIIKSTLPSSNDELYQSRTKTAETSSLLPLIIYYQTHSGWAGYLDSPGSLQSA